MKKICFALLILTAVLSASGQDFRLGVKGTFYSTWLFNTNVADQLEAADYAATFSPSFGITGVLYFTDNMAASIDVLYASNNQKLKSGDLGNNTGYESITRVQYLDFPLMLKISSEGGAYVEIGPQLSLLMGANEDVKTSPSSPFDYTKKDFKNDFSSFNAAGMLGFGVDVQASDNWFINIGLRFAYSFTDATQQFSEADMAIPGKHSLFSHFAHTDAEGDYNYHKTFRAFGGITIGAIYKID